MLNNVSKNNGRKITNFRLDESGFCGIDSEGLIMIGKMISYPSIHVGQYTFVVAVLGRFADRICSNIVATGHVGQVAT